MLCWWKMVAWLGPHCSALRASVPSSEKGFWSIQSKAALHSSLSHYPDLLSPYSITIRKCSFISLHVSSLSLTSRTSAPWGQGPNSAFVSPASRITPGRSQAFKWLFSLKNCESAYYTRCYYMILFHPHPKLCCSYHLHFTDKRTKA